MNKKRAAAIKEHAVQSTVATAVGKFAHLEHLGQNYYVTAVIKEHAVQSTVAAAVGKFGHLEHLGQNYYVTAVIKVE